MTSDSGEDSGTPPQPKSKQERIRDNQRRSRARRQEYLAELERRLAECQLTCREADIQRAAFLELQIENTKLRELLALVGVNDQFVEQYVSQAVAQSGQYRQDPNPALRQLKPKLPSPDSQTLPSTQGQPSLSRVPSRLSTMSDSTSASTHGMRMGEGQLGSLPPNPNYIATTGYGINPSSSLSLSPPPNYGWSYSQSLPAASHLPSQPFRCHTFGIQISHPMRTAGENSVLCSVAKQMIDQHHLSDNEMQQVKSKLATGLCRPLRPGTDCSIDNQTLFQILHELSSRYT